MKENTDPILDLLTFLKENDLELNSTDETKVWTSAREEDRVKYWKWKINKEKINERE